MQRQYIYKFIFFKLWMPKFKAGFTLWLNWCPPLPPLSQTTKESELNPKQSEPEVKMRTFSLRCQKAALPSPGECDSTDLGLTRRGSGGLGWAQGSALLSGSRATLTLLAGALGTAVLAELTGEWWHHAHITEAKEQKILTPEILTFTESTYLRASLVAQQ